MQTVDEALEKLSKSRFRSSFRLSKKDREYFREKGYAAIERHARDFIRQRLAPAFPENDGRQTPMSGHPVFKAQHATACCCRACLNRWYKVPVGVPLTQEQQDRIVRLIMRRCELWMEEEK